jgi:uridine kinase
VSTKSKIIAIAGGSGSGKTTFARRLCEHFDDCSKILLQDSYYIDQSDKFDFDGGSVNFDHPSALDFDLLATHLEELKTGKTVDVPIYDFATHTRSQEVENFEPCRLVFVDGILIISQPQLLPHFDMNIFVHAHEDLRFQRRLKRDIEERGRTEDGVRNQFYKQVKPMHDQFVEPSKDHAHHVVEPENFDDMLKKVINLLSE